MCAEVMSSAVPSTTPVPPAVPQAGPPADTIDDVIARMASINSALPADDGVACLTACTSKSRRVWLRK